MRRILRPALVADIREAHSWYEGERPGLGEEFLTEIDRSMDLAEKHPKMYPVILRDTRRVLVRRFPYGLFYRLVDDAIVFVACYHLRRDPELWKDRR